MGVIFTKTCEVCEVSFTPDPRVGQRQRVCTKLNCQQERKRRAVQRWREKNPNYFKQRYNYLKDWLKAHPDYLRNYRQHRTQRSHRAGGDIQNELSRQQNSILVAANRIRDIQNEITLKISDEQRSLDDLVAMIYKTSQAQHSQCAMSM